MSAAKALSPEQLHEIHTIIATPDLPDLGPKVRADIKASDQLKRELEAIPSYARLTNGTQALIYASALLWHDHLKEAHRIVQDDASTEAAFIHGIVHRREPDYSNAKYWFHRVGAHATFPTIAARVEKLLAGHQAETSPAFISGGAWQPMPFIDACEKVAHRPQTDPEVKLLQQIQWIEFKILLEHLCRNDSD